MSNITGKRYEQFQVDLLDSKDNTVATIGMVKSGVLDYSIFDKIRTGGNIEIVTHKDATEINWLNSRIRIYYLADSNPIFITGSAAFTQVTDIKRSLGVFITSAPVFNYSDTGITAKIELYDKLILPSQESYVNTSYIGGGRFPLGEAANILYWCGISKNDMLIDDVKASQALETALVWEAGTSKLDMINDLLDVIQYRSLWVDVNGKFRFSNWVVPSKRPLEYHFRDNNSSIYLSDFSIEQDFYDIPNVIIAISKTSGQSAAYSVQVINDSADSPFSVQNRGGRKIIRVDRNVDVSEGPEEESEDARRIRVTAELKAYANRILSENLRKAEVLKIKHALVPDLYLNDRVIFENETNGIIAKTYTITNMRINLSPGGLVETTLREVLDIQEFDTVE